MVEYDQEMGYETKQNREYYTIIIYSFSQTYTIH